MTPSSRCRWDRREAEGTREAVDRRVEHDVVPVRRVDEHVPIFVDSHPSRVEESRRGYLRLGHVVAVGSRGSRSRGDRSEEPQLWEDDREEWGDRDKAREGAGQYARAAGRVGRPALEGAYGMDGGRVGLDGSEGQPYPHGDLGRAPLRLARCPAIASRWSTCDHWAWSGLASGSPS